MPRSIRPGEGATDAGRWDVPPYEASGPRRGGVPRTIALSTALPADADRVWEALQRPATFRYVVRGVLGFPAVAGRSAPFVEGDTVTGWLLAFHVLPLHRHTIRVVRVDEEHRRVETEEHGGPLRSWRHVLSVEPTGAGASRYSDVVSIEAGRLTPAVARTATLLYRYRQHRWRRLAGRLSSAEQR